jgi:hypothetical protein
VVADAELCECSCSLCEEASGVVKMTSELELTGLKIFVHLRGCEGRETDGQSRGGRW